MSQKHTKEDFSEALTEFNNEDVPLSTVPEVLEEYLIGVAKTGETTFPWPRMNKVFKAKLDKAIDEFKTDTEFNMDKLPPAPNVENVTFDAIKQRIVRQIDAFIGAPFTIQRLCEMVTNPLSHYKRIDKFLRAIEKNVNVVTTVDPFGKKIVCDTKPLLNGTEDSTPPNLPPTYSSAPWAPAAPQPGIWSPHAPLLHTANGIDTQNNRTIANSNEDENASGQSEPSHSSSDDQSDHEDSDHVTESTSDVGSSLSSAAEGTTQASDSVGEAVAMVTESSSVEAESTQSPSLHQQASRTMDATETAPTLEASRPGKRESTDEEDGLVSPAKRMCLEKEAALTAEVKDAEAVESNGANHDAVNDTKTDDVTSTGDVTNGDHVVDEAGDGEASNDVTEAAANDASDEVVASEDSNDSEALTTSSEDSAAEQPTADATADATADTDDVRAADDVTGADDDDASKDGAGAESVEDASNQ